MYFEKFVASLKIGEKFLRDSNGEIKIPFGSEYSLYLKNVNSLDAVVKITVDGQDVLDNQRLIVRANSFVELEGFMKDNVAKNKFKFIQMTKEIEEHRGITPEDSLIRIEVWFQKPKPIRQEVVTTYVYKNRYDWEWYHPYWIGETRTVNTLNIPQSRGGGGRTSSCYTASMGSTNDNSVFTSMSLGDNSDEGITVKGSEVNQHFNYGSIGELEEQSHVLILKLSGYKVDNSKVETVVTVKDKIECKTCGLKNSSENRFCGRCGTYL
jgi:hypothetical protein